MPHIQRHSTESPIHGGSVAVWRKHRRSILLISLWRTTLPLLLTLGLTRCAEAQVKSVLADHASQYLNHALAGSSRLLVRWRCFLRLQTAFLCILVSRGLLFSSIYQCSIQQVKIGARPCTVSCQPSVGANRLECCGTRKQQSSRPPGVAR